MFSRAQSVEGLYGRDVHHPRARGSQKSILQVSIHSFVHASKAGLLCLSVQPAVRFPEMSSTVAIVYAIRVAKLWAFPVFLTSIVNGLVLLQYETDFSSTSLGFGGFLSLVSSSAVLCCTPLAQYSRDRALAFSRLACARCTGTFALVLLCLSFIAWFQTAASTYACASLEGCPGPELLPTGCQAAACEEFVEKTPGSSIWRPDPNCWSYEGRGRCGDGLNHFVLTSRTPAADWGCLQVACCTTDVTPPPGFAHSVATTSHTCSDVEYAASRPCAVRDACSDYAPAVTAIAGWTALCAFFMFLFLRKVIAAFGALRMTWPGFEAQVPPQRRVDLDERSGRRVIAGRISNSELQAELEMERLERAYGNQRGLPPPVAVSTALPEGAAIDGTPVATGAPVVVVTGVAMAPPPGYQVQGGGVPTGFVVQGRPAER